MTAEIHTTILIILVCWLLLLAADALICGILKITSVTPFRKAFLWGCLSLVIPPAVIAYGSLVERNRFMVERVEIEHQALPAAFDGYKIVHISDIHARSFDGREKHLQKAVDIINSLSPDIITFTGDLITLTPDELEGMTDILGGLRASDGVYSVLGNHDYCIYSDMADSSRNDGVEMLVRHCQEMGWTPLLNENRIIIRSHDEQTTNSCEGAAIRQDSIAVIGVENTSPSRHFPSRGDLAKASDGTENTFRILLSHDPLHWESEIVGHDYPLTLSGHTHSMQFSLFGWSPSRYLFPQYRGLYCIEDSKGGDSGETSDIDMDGRQYLYVNTGLGETIFPARIGVRPEITLITLRRSTSNNP